ncbi:MAG: putative DNA-binding domain-containing protein [Gammaproteobacteria bacterium]|nr:putative DNA-binding domain-containing protein [Gammaproteobacteria bacterium]
MKRQLEFAAHIRNPSNPAPADIEDRRMAIYRELFFNNIEDFMASSYPVVKEVLGDECWRDLIRHYYIHHGSETPLFPSMPAEFLNYLQSDEVLSGLPSFLFELAHYEWSELALAISSDELELNGIDPNASLLDKPPVLSPLVLPLSYRFQVHRISLSYQPQAPDIPAFLIVYRDRLDKVRFMETNQITLRLVQEISENPDMTGQQLLERLAAETGLQGILSHGSKALVDLKSRGIILGTKR